MLYVSALLPKQGIPPARDGGFAVEPLLKQAKNTQNTSSHLISQPSLWTVVDVLCKCDGNTLTQKKYSYTGIKLQRVD